MSQFTLHSAQDTLIACIKGEIDHHTAAGISSDLDAEILCRMPRLLVMDFSAVSFMDSSGIGLILGRRRLMETIQGEITVQAVPKDVARIIKLAGINEIVKNSEVKTV